MEFLADSRDKCLVNSIPTLTCDLPVVDLPRGNAAKYGRDDLGLILVLNEIDAPQPAAAHAPKALGQLIEIVVHRLDRQESFLLGTDVPAVEDPTHGAYEFLTFNEGLLRELRDKPEYRVNVLTFGRCRGFNLRPILLDIQKDALRFYRDRGVGR